MYGCGAVVDFNIRSFPLDASNVLVIDQDNKLRLDSAPFSPPAPARALDGDKVSVLRSHDNALPKPSPDGIVTSPLRAPVDGNAIGFEALDDDTVYTLDSDGELWLELGPSGEVPPQPAASPATGRPVSAASEAVKGNGSLR